jgi:DNA invertase Pin-like site-specific DNA recombinase
MSDKIRVAVYCRLACKNKEIIKSQKDEMLAYAKELGYKNITVYSDNGYSGSNFNRPAFMRMESDIVAGKIGLVISKNITCIGRDMIGTVNWIDKIERSGIPFLSVSDGAMGSSISNIRSLVRQIYRKHCVQ